VTATQASILGLLAYGERTPYELVKAAEATVGYFWAPAKSQLYALLPRLVDDGLVALRRVGRAGHADRRLYSLTPAGEAALREWINAPSPAEPSRNALLLQLFFGEFGDPEALLEHVRARRHELEQLEHDLRRIERESPAEGDFYQSMTRRYGLAYARALADWARATEDELTAALP
jgi:DNA-binding PadR family transcriptional regulator